MADDVPQNHGLSALAQAIDSSPMLQNIKQAWKGVEDIINGAIYAVGDRIGNTLNALKEVKGPLVALGGSSLGGDPSSMPPITPSVTPEPSHGQSKSKTISGPSQEIKIAMEKSGPSSHAMGLKCEHCDRADSGLFASPYTPSLGPRSQGMAIG